MSLMQPVLVITYYFPPLGGSSVQRPLKFVKYLPAYGWQPHVLTVKARALLQDASQVEEIPRQTPISRAPAMLLPLWLPWRVRNFISRWFFCVDEQVGWWPFAVSSGRQVLQRFPDTKVIYSASMPFTSHLVAYTLHKQTQLPWVADFSDPWVENPYINFPTVIHKQLNEFFERKVFTSADRIVVNTETTRKRYIDKYSQLPPSKIIAIPNGYDRADIPTGRNNLNPNPAFTIIHLGSFFPRTRSSKHFLGALALAIKAGGLPPGKLKVQFIGNIDKETRMLVSQLGFDNIVELIAYLPHRQALNHLLSADLLLLIPSYGLGSELFVPSKAYEYLASLRPILCLAEPGACADLVTRAQSGVVVPPSDTNRIGDELVRAYRQWEQGSVKIEPRLDVISALEWRELTGKVSDLFSEICR